MGGKIPLIVGGAKLFEYLLLEKKHSYTGNTEHWVGGKLVNEFYALSICQYDNAPGFYLFYCDADWNAVTDTWHATVEDAKEQADFEYADTLSDWRRFEKKVVE